MLLNKNYINSSVFIKTCEKVRINKTPGDSPWNHASKKLKKNFHPTFETYEWYFHPTPSARKREYEIVVRYANWWN